MTDPTTDPAKPRRTRKTAVAPAAEGATDAAGASEAAPAPAKAPRARKATAAGEAMPASDGLPRRKKAIDKQAAKERPSIDIARRIVELAEDKKAAEIVLLDLTGLTGVADYFVVCSGGSERQLDAIADGIVSGMRDEGIRAYGREGTPASHWVLVDFGGVIVHIFTPPERDYYQLERHWSEAKTILRVE